MNTHRVEGDGPFDLLLALPWMEHLEVIWDWAPSARFLEAFTSFSRLILYDRRGTGLSDRLPGGASFEDSMDDISVVLDAAGSERAALLGMAEGGPLCARPASPKRTAHG